MSRRTAREPGCPADDPSWLGDRAWAAGATGGGDWKTINWGDDVSAALAAALAAAVTLWNQGRHAVSLSLSYE